MPSDARRHRDLGFAAIGPGTTRCITRSHYSAGRPARFLASSALCIASARSVLSCSRPASPRQLVRCKASAVLDSCEPPSCESPRRALLGSARRIARPCSSRVIASSGCATLIPKRLDPWLGPAMNESSSSALISVSLPPPRPHRRKSAICPTGNGSGNAPQFAAHRRSCRGQRTGSICSRSEQSPRMTVVLRSTSSFARGVHAPVPLAVDDPGRPIGTDPTPRGFDAPP